MLSLKRVCKSLCFYFILMLFTGCYKENEAPSNEDSSPVLTTTTDLTNASNCGCAFRELSFALAVVGATIHNTVDDSREKIDSIRNKLASSAKTLGAEFRVINVEEVARLAVEARFGSRFYALLVSRDGHFYGLLGALNIDGKTLYQVCHGGMGPLLLPRESLSTENFQEAWLCQRESTNVAIPLGEAKLLIDKAWVNFGEVRPLSKLACEFYLENIGASTIVIGKPQTTCGCVIPSIESSITLLAGEKYTMKVEISAGTAQSFEQRIVMQCWEAESGVSKEFSLTLLGNQRASMKITPCSLNFGILYPGEKVERELFLKETPTDKFCISSVSTSDGSLTWIQSQEEVGSERLKVYRFLITLLIPKESNLEGSQKETLTLLTSSSQYPQIKIPIDYVVRPRITVTPEIVSFGTCRIGEVVDEEISVVSAGNSPAIEIKSDSLPSGFSLEHKTRNVYKLSFTPEHTGVFEENIELELSNQEQAIRRTIKCVGNVL